MSTTDHQKPVHRLDTQYATSKIVRVDALKRRRRLETLLSTRSHLATIAAQQRSHGIGEAQESFNLQLVTETAIKDEFPKENERYFDDWISTEVAEEHAAGVLTADCGTCRAIAARDGVNLTPPEAA
jgi:hypothetical protein